MTLPDLGQETPRDSKSGPRPPLHSCQSTGKSGWLLCSPVSSVLLLSFLYPFFSVPFLTAKAVQPLFLELVTFFLNSVQSSHAAEIFFHAGCDIALYGDLSFPVTPESVGNNYSIYSNILRKHTIIKNLTWLPEASSSNFQSN